MSTPDELEFILEVNRIQALLSQLRVRIHTLEVQLAAKDAEIARTSPRRRSKMTFQKWVNMNCSPGGGGFDFYQKIWHAAQEAILPPCEVCAKRAKVRVSVHAVWLRERARRERAEAEIARLRACMQRAGMQCFMSTGTPEEVAQHMEKIAASGIGIEKEVARLRALVAAGRELYAICAASHDFYAVRIADKWRDLDTEGACDQI